MLRSFIFILLAGATIGAASAATVTPWTSMEHGGLGLKPPGAAASSLTGRVGLRTDAPYAWPASESRESAYAGERDALRLGTRATESFSGIYYPLSETWGATLETAVLQDTALLPRRYSLAGQLHTPFAGGGLSFGLKYRVYDTEAGHRAGMHAEPGAYGYALVASRIPGASFGPSYQLQLSYQYNAANVFGLALGREVETFTPGFEGTGNGRQFTFTGQHWLTPSWALSYDLLSSDPGAFRLQGLRLGVRYRF